MSIRKVIITSLVALMLPFASQSVVAGMVTTPSLIENPVQHLDITSARAAIQQQLIELGVEQTVAIDRVAQMSNSQVAEITQRLDELPAGAGAGGILLTVFIVFVITDVIGATDIFPFIKPVK